VGAKESLRSNVGFESNFGEIWKRPVTEEELLRKGRRNNENPYNDGLIVQLPLSEAYFRGRK